ncbi:hypothetical protein JMF97_30745, partial [Micromonospora fiedleri]|nr:hypothetical protein [Micromonospora fiedleri]
MARRAACHAYLPPSSGGLPALRTTPTGLLVPSSARLSLTLTSRPDIETEQTDPSPAVGSPAPPPVEPSPDTTATQPTDRLPQAAEPTNAAESVDQAAALPDEPTTQVSAQADQPVRPMLAAVESAGAADPAAPPARPRLTGQVRP